MKFKLLFIAFCLFCSCVFAEQRVFVLEVNQGGEFSTLELERLISSEWKVISATPIQSMNRSDNPIGPEYGKLYTKKVIYILEKRKK